MTDLEKALLGLVGDLQVALKTAQENQLKVIENGDKIIITYKDKIVYTAKPI